MAGTETTTGTTGRRRSWRSTGILLAVIGVAALAVAAQLGRDAATTGEAPLADQATLPVVEVYKDPSCGCCAKWADHMRAAGFVVRTVDTGDLASLKAAHGVPAQAQACHTALVDGYVIEGHVPATDVQRLLRERPAIAGIAVGGMPTGSPGMEMAGVPPQPYDVLAFDSEGQTQVFESHR